MYPYLRMIQVWHAASRGPRIGLLDTTHVRTRAWPNDLDFNLHVNNGRYLTLADLGRVDWFVRTGVLEVARKRGAYPVVGDSVCRFRREIRAFERFDLQTRLRGWDERFGYLEHRYVVGGRVVALVGIRGIFRGREGTVPPHIYLEDLAPHLDSPPLPDWATHFRDGAEAIAQMLRAEEAARGLR
jgi:acyl-CoA thioesterase FadM